MNKSNFVKNLVFLISEIDLLKNQEQNLRISLKVLNDKIERLVENDLKSLQSEERIVRIASDSLGLVRSLKPFDEIIIDNNRVKQIEKIVNEDYD
jgi:hypothetical protein